MEGNVVVVVVVVKPVVVLSSVINRFRRSAVKSFRVVCSLIFLKNLLLLLFCVIIPKVFLTTTFAVPLAINWRRAIRVYKMSTFFFFRFNTMCQFVDPFSPPNVS